MVWVRGPISLFCSYLVFPTPFLKETILSVLQIALLQNPQNFLLFDFTINSTCILFLSWISQGPDLLESYPEQTESSFLFWAPVKATSLLCHSINRSEYCSSIFRTCCFQNLKMWTRHYMFFFVLEDLGYKYPLLHWGNNTACHRLLDDWKLC